MCFSTMLEADFIDVKVIKLKKDEQKKILVKYDSKEKLFQFRWTLYKNDGLVVFRSYDKIVAQNILYIRNKNQSFRFYLKPKGGKSYDVPYVLVKFKAFDYETNEATFELYLSDKNMQISLKYL
ncbi:MAG: hypothetical protein GW906_06750 [Epsilonproteobacteria bacterium]|nr:hypothetical protein [Campylobacterota bacterium]PIP10671.1 MAG: hypothetical protein COX50_04900 [Sulfurimonas sp. CG23_combo_of_CG06-09_8_20_14_all_36_33]PIS25644.1 MAG: hypothetical protein COT46_05580 [Sulfurimonas sp. CG08_land_8_20_14_0_20_36_33]PIU34950.1 MAG: hypothetical protein COT05_05780 [Sulfurimonas sp. CG07_land_8_20_14_0_80_36_56]PIV04664.1 MAG: hypothetical protein COS56_04400 [Sulfurimonas sp. CG03_land_8_20_14_0_80_36_25]PIV36470.1 MAG: hypothetical protein COS32_02630 [S